MCVVSLSEVEWRGREEREGGGSSLYVCVCVIGFLWC